MGEILLIHVGEAGCRVGSEMWKLFCKEHNIDPTGKKKKSKNKVWNISGFEGEENRSLFSENIHGRLEPRCVFLDLDPQMPNLIKRRSKYRLLFQDTSFVSGKENASDNYARGMFTLFSPDMYDRSVNAIRQQVEKCNSLQGIFFFHSVSGGTGSGWLSELNHRIEGDYEKKSKVSFTLFPSPNISSSTVESYNSILSTTNFVEFMDMCVL